ncbi:MAG: hypothetical protein DRQ55_09110 [Planctomycetota bacterium]|nr:MAG: hypothetical protein DRQ55_09110 [Planctomycetota bacterium]
MALGMALLLIAAGASMALVLQAVIDLPLPGCGPSSACARLSASSWGRLPGVGWPVADLGLAWFLALFVAWKRSGGRLVGPWRAAARVGAVASVVWALVMLQAGSFCPWCLTVHVANLAFLVLLERAARAPSPARAPRAPLRLATPVLTTFFVVSALLGVIEWRHAARIAERDSAEYERSLAAITSGGGEAAAASPALTGRYRLGPAVAPLRLVIFSDYQCPDCRTLDDEVEALMAARDDVSVSVRHFPQCTDCNRRFRSSGINRHKNACWAARAAEAAGRLHGVAGFWSMHRWLFSRGASFNEEQLDTGLAGMGFERSEFLQVMMGSATLDTVERDVEDALALGIGGTPFVFLNGVEFRGWQVQGALARAVEAVAASNPPAAGPEADRPPRGLDKTVADWRAEPRRTMPADLVPWELVGGERVGGERVGGERADGMRTGSSAQTAAGVASGRVVTVTLFGDYREPNTAQLDRRMRAAVASRPGTRYVYRQYPFDSSCNPHFRGLAIDGSCLAARAAEAAGQVGGPAAFWSLHDWLMDQPTGAGSVAPTLSALLEAARQLGLDGEALAVALDGPLALAALRDDCDAGRQLGIHSLPALFIDGRRAPRWKEGVGVPEHLLDLARGGG